MEPKWQNLTLIEIAANIPNATVGGPFGSNLVSKDYTTSGVPVIRGQNMSFGRSIGGDFAFVSEEKAEALKSNIAKPGDVVFTQRGTLGQVAIIPNEPWKTYVVSQSQMKATLDLNKADPQFIYYYFSNPHEVNYILSNAIQTGVPHSNLTQLRAHPIRLPPLNIQKSIAHVLGSLDDKIELNRQINTTLENMAQALFKSWFVDFDPVLDNALAAGNPIPEALADKAAARKTLGDARKPLPEDIRKLFPAAFVWTEEMGWVPEGWEISTAGQEFNTVGGATPSTKNSEFWEGGCIHWTTPKDLSNATSKILFDTDRKITQKGLKKISSGLLPVDTVLMSSRAPVGYLALAKVPVAINQGYIAMRCEKIITPEYAIQWANSVMDEIKQRAGGTTFSEISKRNFREIKLLVPHQKLVEGYSKTAKIHYEKITKNLQQSTSLTKLRDTLLPKLLSGELRIPDAEKLINQTT